jgi:hypothetical protein
MQGAPSAAVNGLVPHQQQAAYGDSRCGYASTTPQQQQQQQLPSLGEVEQLLLQLPRGGRDTGAASAEQQAAWRARFASSSAAVAGLEQLASAATLQYMDAQGAAWRVRVTGLHLHVLPTRLPLAASSVTCSLLPLPPPNTQVA